MQCDICGSEGPQKRAMIEGTELNVCSRCAAYGKVVGPVRVPKKSEPARVRTLPEKEMIQIITEGYPALVKAARERLGMKQIELALKISVKESVIHKIESGHFEPPLELARKLERFLKIQLVEEHEEVHEGKRPASGNELTLGDFVKIRKRHK
ncbi:MAG: multiprotein bridging factor aMBF1 [archaeon]